MWFANFFIAGSMTMVLPFLSLYIETLGNFSDAYVQTWSGLIFAVTFVTAALFSPIWGRIGDRFGRKNVLIILGIGLGTSVFLMGFVTSIMQLFFLRLFMGIFTGFIPMSQALIATQTPRKMAGRVLGTLQTGNITGSLMGPLIGGALADSIGFAQTFQSLSFVLLIASILVWTSIKEVKINSEEGSNRKYSGKEVLSHIIHHPMMLTVMLLAMIVQIAHFSIQPILSLYVGELHGPVNLAFFSGMAFSAAGLGNLIMARNWGKLGDNKGYLKILMILLFLAGVVYLPGAFVTNIWQLTFIRFLLGFSIGGIMPLLVAYIRQEAPISIQGEVLGYNTSLRFTGNIIGPVLGGTISSYFGISSVFFVTSFLLISSGGILYLVRHKMSKSNNSPILEKP
ncbi:MFS transporter [Bacillaceae bacterium S4-13-56]